jgi:hypothetical protein
MSFPLNPQRPPAWRLAQADASLAVLRAAELDHDLDAQAAFIADLTPTEQPQVITAAVSMLVTQVQMTAILTGSPIGMFTAAYVDGLRYALRHIIATGAECPTCLDNPHLCPDLTRARP